MNAPAAARGRPDARVLALAAPLFVLAAVAWHRTLATLWTTWSTNDNYSHGPLVPLTSLALVWLRRDRLARLAVRPQPLGLLLLALGCAMQVVGTRADLFALQGWSVIPVLLGLSLAFLGVAFTRMLAFPILYLGFMLTFPPVVMNTLSFALKEFSVGASVAGAKALGVLLERDGMSIHLAAGTLRVENPCSGLRSLLALLATGTLFAYIQKGGAWRRAAVLLAAVPIAILGNAVRLLLVILAADRRGVVWASGAFHDATGYVVYAVALAALLGLRHVLTPRPGPGGAA
jgi:exosortase